MPTSKEAEQECRIQDIRITGSTASWKIVCGGNGGQMRGTGQVTYHGETMDGKMHMIIVNAGTEVTNILSGRRIGPCDGQAAAETPRSNYAKPVEPPARQTSQVEETLADDAQDIGKAAKDEAKQSTVEEVRKGVRSVFKGLFK